MLGERASAPDVWEAGEVGLSLEGLATELRALSDTTDTEASDLCGLMAELADRTADMAARLRAVEHSETEAARATVTIARREQAGA